MLPTEGSKPWMRYAGLIESGDPESSRKIDDVVPSQKSRPLPRRFYERSALDLAPGLLGKILVHRSKDGVVAARIVEVEAYCGPADRAAHSSGGRRTARNEVMWGAAGHLYVYFVYGMHWCANVVAAKPGCPEAVLLRAAEPGSGVGLMRRRRGKVPDRDLLRGPANLCKALGITGRENGEDLTRSATFLVEGSLAADERIVTTTRVGVDYAGDDAKKPWRFLIAGSPFVSKPPLTRPRSRRAGSTGRSRKAEKA